ncbi:MAG TPA: hypothetical protein DCM86_12300 [Verrucomicrobiales bacterium]|nr:hypothetical protein [Verrucomicrobiales bacterium]
MILPFPTLRRSPLTTSLVLAAGLLPLQGAELSYERDVAPILRSHCAGCHNDVDLSGGLSVERYATLRTGGKEEGDPLIPGNPDASFLLRSLEGRTSPKMPPKEEPLVPAGEIALLRQWIAGGAKGPAADGSILETLVVPEGGERSRQPTPVTALAPSPDHRRLAVGRYGVVELRSSDGRRVLRTMAGLPGKVNGVRFSPDGRLLAIATGIAGLQGVAHLHDVGTGRLIRTFGGHRDLVQAAEFSPDGRLLATAGYDRKIRIWTLASGHLEREIAVHNGAVFDLAFSPDGRVLASASADQTVKLWRVSDGERLDTLNQPQGEVYKVAFSPDGGHIVAAGADRRLHLWKFTSHEQPGPNPVIESRFAHEAAIQAFSFSPGGRELITSGADRSVKLWSFPGLVELHAFAPQPDIVVSFSPPAKAGGEFLSGSMNGTITPLPVPRLAGAARGGPEPAAPRRGSPAPEGTSDASTHLPLVTEVEPNDQPSMAQPVRLPVEIQGRIQHGGDRDLFRFHATRGEELALAVNAARSGSKLDSRIEVLHADGTPVEQVVLQAVRDSWFTFRGKDSETSDDFRLQNWTEMQLDQYLYAEGEVVRLWLYPRGPDSGFKVYPGTGKRQTWFSTTAVTHALNAPAYIVVPGPAGSHPVPNGLPFFRLNYENDDDPARRWGTDSLLLFTPPADGDYLARLTDVRGFGGETNFAYTLAIRGRRPDFTVAIEGLNPKVSPGSGREIRFTATRTEGFDGPIRIEVEGLPDGFTSSLPLEIEAGQESAIATLHAAPGTRDPDAQADARVRITATARVGGRDFHKDLGSLGDLQLGAAAKVTLAVLPGSAAASGAPSAGMPTEFLIHPGETITAKVRAVRADFTGRIELGGEDSGRNLPHGVYVDNIGLNGLLIVEGQTEREFFITAAPKVRPGVRRFHLRTTADGGQASEPVTLRVVAAEGKVAGAK